MKLVLSLCRRYSVGAWVEFSPCGDNPTFLQRYLLFLSFVLDIEGLGKHDIFGLLLNPI